MSVVGGALAGRGGPQVAAVIIAGGLVAGALGSVVVTNVTGPGTEATASGAVYASDDDQPNDGLKVVFYWTLVDVSYTPAATLSGHMSASVSSGGYYQGTTSTFDGNTYWTTNLKVYVVTADRYGGTTRSATQSYANCT